MAQQQYQLDHERLVCSICLELLQNPVIIPCGHSYCMNCIKRQWETEDQKKIYSCPQCRQTFKPRPGLVRNIILGNLVEELKNKEDKATPSAHCCATPGAAACGPYPGRKPGARPVNKSRLQHVHPHHDVIPLKKPKLAEASAKPQWKICPLHNELMKVFCHTDQTTICYLCAMKEHKGHDQFPAEEIMTRRKEKIGPSQKKIQQRIQERERDVELLQQEMGAINHSAEKTVRENEKMSSELVQLIERRSINVKHKIKDQQRLEVNRVKRLQDRLKQEISELKRKDAELMRLSRTKDQTEFLRNFPSISCLSGSTNSLSINLRPVRYFEDAATAVSEAKDKLEEHSSEEWKKILKTVTEVDVLLPQDPKTKAEFSPYAADRRTFKLDPNTANIRLVLSEENRKVTLVKDEQSRSISPDTFMDKSQVLGTESLTGRCYWEVQWSGLSVFVAVAYKDIARRGEESGFGNSDKSWVLECSNKGYSFKHNGEKIPILAPQSSRVGVFLDHRAGILSFHSISETITPLYRVQTTFTQPLYAGLGTHYYGSSAEFCQTR